MPNDAPVSIEGVSHYYGSGDLRKQVLHDISIEIRSGEILILTGPSGSGKTTLLTLIGALRSAQEGSVRVLGQELRGASAARLESVRKQIGYIFQAHNLIDALTARQNVELSLYLHPHRSRREARTKAQEVLEAVGLGDRVHHHPSQLSGGQRQRVAIARALASEPRILLADEPTASLDKKSGLAIVERMRGLARDLGVTVLLVTHDNRILDIADRIIHLEDGRLSSFTDAVVVSTQRLMKVLADDTRKADLVQMVETMPEHQFVQLLERLTEESRRFLEATSMANNEAFESMLNQALFAFMLKLSRILEVEAASLFLVDEERKELWLRVAHDEEGNAIEHRMPLNVGIAGAVATSGQALKVDDAYAHPLFNPAVDRETGFCTRSILCLPLHNVDGHVFAVAQLLNPYEGKLFTELHEKRFEELVPSIVVMLETWWEMARTRRRINGEAAA